MRRVGYQIPTDLIAGDELHALEPGLSERVRFGALIPEQWHVRADSFVASLGNALRRRGVEIIENSPVRAFRTSGESIVSATTDGGDCEGSSFLICAGSWTKDVAAMVNVNLPIEAGKGYSFMVSSKKSLSHGVLFPEAHAGATPLRSGVRIGGTMEFSGYDVAVNDERVQTILAHVRDLIDLVPGEPRDAWAGLRPTSADGLPIVDRLPNFRNTFVASGYSMLGMTLAEPAGAAMADFIATDRRPPLLEPFRADRFPRSLATGFLRRK
jgi:D-amino-acid dehydrogenase